MAAEDAVKKLKKALSTAPKPKVEVKSGRIEIEAPDGQKEEASEIQRHEFKLI